MADQVYRLVLARAAEQHLILKRCSKQALAVSGTSRRSRTKNGGENHCQHAKDNVTHPWRTVEMGTGARVWLPTEIRVQRNSLQKSLRRPSNRPLKSSRAPVEFTITTTLTLRQSRRIRAQRRGASSVSNNQTDTPRTIKSTPYHRTPSTSVICPLERWWRKKMESGARK